MMGALDVLAIAGSGWFVGVGCLSWSSGWWCEGVGGIGVFGGDDEVA
jgi:hypothetical protein